MNREELLETPLSDLEERLSMRAWHILNFAGIETIGQLLSYDQGQLKKFRNCGKKTVNEIRAFLGKYQLDLAEPSSNYVIGRLEAKIRQQELTIYRQSRDIDFLKRSILQLQFGGKNE